MCWAWVPPLEYGACHDEHLHAPVLRGAKHVLRHVLHHAPRHALRRVLRVLILNVPPKGRRGGRCACVGRGFRRWKVMMGKHLHAPVLRGTHAPRHVLRRVLHVRCSNFELAVKRPEADLVTTDTQAPRAIGNYPLCALFAHMPLPVLRSQRAKSSMTATGRGQGRRGTPRPTHKQLLELCASASGPTPTCSCRWATSELPRSIEFIALPFLSLDPQLPRSGQERARTLPKTILIYSPAVRAYAPTRSSTPHPRAPIPDPRLKPGPVFAASGVVNTDNHRGGPAFNG